MIALEHVSKSFGEREVLRDASFDVADGEFAILFGPSGVGKTLVLSILAGLERPTSGRVLIGGVDVTRVSPEKRSVTLVFQGHALFPHLTVFENIAFSLRARHKPHALIQRRVSELMALTGLEDYAASKPDVLSGGQRQRVAFARALASDADVILFDEPLSSLDGGLKKGLMAELLRLHREIRFTAVYVTHDLQEALTLGERVYLLENGHIVCSGTPLELLGQFSRAAHARSDSEAKL